METDRREAGPTGVGQRLGDRGLAATRRPFEIRVLARHQREQERLFGLSLADQRGVEGGL